jgi:hypothetical protein
MWKYVLFAVVLLLSAAAAFVAWVLWSLRGPSGPEWERHPQHQLLRSGDLVGATWDDVLERVGPPEWVDDRAWYDLGPAGDFSGLVIYYEGDLQRSILMLHCGFESEAVERTVARRLPSTFPDEPFEEQRWAEAEPTGRRAMLRSLLASGGLEGLPRAEVFALLGPPSGRTREIVFEDPIGGMFFTIDYVHLVFDDEDVVTDWYLTDN